MLTNIKGNIKYVSLNNFDNVYSPFVNNGKKVKITDKKLKSFYKVYGDETVIYPGMLHGEFTDILCQISKRLSKVPLFPPDIKIEVNQNGITIFVGMLSMFNDLLPHKIKTKMYYKKFIYIKKLCELLVMRFKV